MNEFRLDGMLAAITGSNKGIGLGIARAMAEAGADVILIARNEEELAGAAEEVRQTGRKVAYMPLDLRETARIPSFYAELVREHGHPNVLVNSAGITRRGPAEELSMEDWDDTLAVNLTSVFALSQAFAKRLIAVGEKGRIINIASLMTAAARKATSAYTASKGGLGQLTKALAVDWAEKGILVNAIAPGYITTKMTRPLWEDHDFDSWVKGRTPLGRWGAPKDIAMPCVFLASPAADFITGQVIYVDGGWTATF